MPLKLVKRTVTGTKKRKLAAAAVKPSKKRPKRVSKKPKKLADKEDLTAEGPACKVLSKRGKLPTRNKAGKLVFEGYPDFRPNLSPQQVLQMGSFGGTYFRPIYSGVTKKSYTAAEVTKEYPKEWFKGLNMKKQVTSSNYQNSVNQYNAKCGGSLEMWESKGWMANIDPYGWFQWYCRFYQGRRSTDDDRQIGRWKKCTSPKGRWRNNLIGKIFRSSGKINDLNVSPVIRQVLQHWGYKLTQADYNEYIKLKGWA